MLQRKVGVAVFSEEVDIRAKDNAGNKEVHFILRSFNQENIEVLNIYITVNSFKCTK